MDVFAFRQRVIADYERFSRGSALHVMLFPENLMRALLIFNGLRSRYWQRALLVYHYPRARPPVRETHPRCL